MTTQRRALWHANFLQSQKTVGTPCGCRHCDLPCSDSEDEGERGGPRPDDEAEEEDDEFEAIFKGQKSKRRRPAHAESVTKGVEDLLAHMEVAAERDMEATKDARPAFMKLKMLKEVRLLLM